MQETKFYARPKQKTAPALILIAALAIVGLLGAVALGPKTSPPPPDGVTMFNYERLQTDMTYAQACEILGKPGTEISRGEIPGYVTVLYEWRGKGMANLHAMFQNDKLINKAQFGLK